MSLPRFFTLHYLNTHRWRILIGLIAIALLYFLLRPEKDPAEIIRENIHSWVQQLEKLPPEGTAADSKAAAPQKNEAAMLLEDFGVVRRLVRDAFTESAVVRAARGPRESGREAITSHVYALRNQAESLKISLGEITVQVPAASGGLPNGKGAAAAPNASAPSDSSANQADDTDADASLRVIVQAVYQGQTYTQAYDCNIRLIREEDNKWRIQELVAQVAPIDSVPASDTVNPHPAK